MWKRATIADEGTHHVVDGVPLYEPRFDEVLAFHAPGLAPVRRGGVAWHVDDKGQDAYSQRFHGAFGFYESRAAVTSPEGWHHIRPDGSDAYADRYAWCGNVQEARCAVRGGDRNYWHIDPTGTPAYADRWRYAGDFRGGIAVVQAADGRSTHIDRFGGRVHDRWFRDLDAFHKGAARARDDRGWFHIGRDGVPLFERRFAMVEPFYNGQARVERFDGGLEVIEASGEMSVELRAATKA